MFKHRRVVHNWKKQEDLTPEDKRYWKKRQSINENKKGKKKQKTVENNIHKSNVSQ